MGRSLAVVLVEASERFLGDALGRLEAAGYGGLAVSHAFAVQLIGSGVATITALSEAMRMTPQAVSAIVNHLEARGLVIRGRLEGDARARILTLTEDGDRLAAAVAAAVDDIEREWADLVGGRQLAQVKATLAAYLDVGSAPPALAQKRRRVRIV
jgi:DNA-binding MarR family transcriptional regulator